MSYADDRPNIVLITTDQHRGDCLGIDGHPVLKTPYLDDLAARGVRFTSAYSACPQCVPARRTLLTGRTPEGHGVYRNSWMPLLNPTLPEVLANAGYQTHLVGKLHFWPKRKLYGFMSADWSDHPHGDLGDYGLWLRDQGFANPERNVMAHGVRVNGWKARPWHLDERYHFTNWVTDRSLNFLDRRDPSVPFFLNVSYFHPHGPCTPPEAYWNQYISKELPDPITADWSTTQHGFEPGLPVESWHTVLDGETMHRWRAGYFASITHIDDQIGVLLRSLPPNTVVLFTSDHGEMLGDHQWIRKTRALEPSARVPFLIRFPDSMDIAAGQIRDEPVELMDIMPTCLEAAGVDVPESVEGTSLIGLLQGAAGWRQYVHGEISGLGGASPPTGMQFLTNGKRKYIWEPATGRELFFDLETDPQEQQELSGEPQRSKELSWWRQRLVERLERRPEGFVDNGKLVKLNGPTDPVSPRVVAAKADWSRRLGVSSPDAF